MKLNGSFFEIISATVPASYRIRLNPGHEIYKAHFPEQPITPGVIIVRMAMELLSEALGRKAHLVGAPNIKFSSPLFPRVEAAPAMAPATQSAGAGKEVDFQITIKEGNMASIVVSDAGTVFSKMLIRYE